MCICCKSVVYRLGIWIRRSINRIYTLRCGFKVNKW